jgi:hypothetical protein
LIKACENAGIGEELIQSELSFAEHRVNGKSRGAAYLMFETFEATMKARELFNTM